MYCHIFVFLLILNVKVWQEPYCLYLCLTVIKQVKLNEHLSQPYLQGTISISTSLKSLQIKSNDQKQDMFYLCQNIFEKLKMINSLFNIV